MTESSNPTNTTINSDHIDAVIRRLATDGVRYAEDAYADLLDDVDRTHEIDIEAEEDRDVLRDAALDDQGDSYWLSLFALSFAGMAEKDVDIDDQTELVPVIRDAVLEAALDVGLRSEQFDARDIVTRTIENLVRDLDDFAHRVVAHIHGSLHHMTDLSLTVEGVSTETGMSKNDAFAALTDAVRRGLLASTVHFHDGVSVSHYFPAFPWWPVLSAD